MLNVVGQQQMQKGYLAAISFGFDRDDEMVGPFLDPLNPQSEYAETFLELVTGIAALPISIVYPNLIWVSITYLSRITYHSEMATNFGMI